MAEAAIQRDTSYLLRSSKGRATRLGFYLAYWSHFRLMDWAIRHCMDAEVVCEIGPGRGHVYQWCKRRSLRYIAIDRTGDSYKAGMELVVTEVPPLPRIIADVYVLFAVLEHMDGPKGAIELMKSIYANLKPGGIVVVAVPDIRFDGRFFWENSMEHKYVTSMRGVGLLLERCGFTIVQREMVISGIRLPLGYLIALPARILRWLYVLFRPCMALTTGHKISMQTPSAYLVGQKDG